VTLLVDISIPLLKLRSVDLEYQQPLRRAFSHGTVERTENVRKFHFIKDKLVQFDACTSIFAPLRAHNCGISAKHCIVSAVSKYYEVLSFFAVVHDFRLTTGR